MTPSIEPAYTLPSGPMTGDENPSPTLASSAPTLPPPSTPARAKPDRSVPKVALTTLRSPSEEGFETPKSEPMGFPSAGEARIAAPTQWRHFSSPLSRNA